MQAKMTTAKFLSGMTLAAAMGFAGLSTDRASAATLPNTDISVYAMGNSLTYGFTGSNVGGRTNDSGWRKTLYANLLEAGLNSVDMLGTQNDSDSSGEGGVATVMVNGSPVAFDGDHDGHSGWRIDATAETSVPSGGGLDDRTGSSNQGLFEAVDSGVFDANLSAADILMLSIGINDVRRGIVDAFGGPLDGNQAGHASSAARLNNLIIEIMDGGHGFTGTMLVSNITPVATGVDPFGGYEAMQGPGSFTSDEVNDAIDLVNAEFATFFDGSGNHLVYGDKVRLVDAHGAINRNTDIIGDGLHLNGSGNLALGNAYSTAVLSVVPEPGSMLAMMIGGLALTRRRRA